MASLLLKCVLLLSLAIVVQSAMDMANRKSKAERRAERRSMMEKRSKNNQEMIGRRSPGERGSRRSQDGGFGSRRRRFSLTNMVKPWRTPMGDFKIPGKSGFGRGRGFGGRQGMSSRGLSGNERMSARGLGGNQRIPGDYRGYRSDVEVNPHLQGVHH